MTSIVMEEYELLGDSKYRSYMSLVDKALRAFEYTTEWPDLIAALGKLNKVLLAHMKYPIVPRRIVISKRLAQCMHPVLPSGVHLKALDTYDIIFKCMGTNRLAQELFLYSAGLFPLLGHAAMNVRPGLLTVYETHFVPLGERLRPALNGLLSGVLPGLEEGSDHFERTNRLLESVCEASHPVVFYGAVWECVAANPSIRFSAITFILQHLDRRRSVREQPHVLGSDEQVLVHAVCAAVTDSSVLVQRSALDLLLLAFPPHDSGLTETDLVGVASAACSVLLRRDMSLNRRLFNWMLGCDVGIGGTNPSGSGKGIQQHVRQESISSTASGESSTTLTFYFEYYSKSMLVEALRIVFARSLETVEQPDLKPLRLLVTLLDKPEIGPLVIDDVIIDVFRMLYHSYQAMEQRDHKSEDIRRAKQELIKNANLLFGTLESGYVWEFCGAQFERASEADERLNDTHEEVNGVGFADTTVIEMAALVEFLLDVVSIETYVETHSRHLPGLFHTVANVVAAKCDRLTPREIENSVKLCKRILTKVQPPWNAWDAQQHQEDAETVNASTGTPEEDQAAKMWSDVGKDLSDEEDMPSGLMEKSAAEVGKEATESLTNSPELQGEKKSQHAKPLLFSPPSVQLHQQHEQLMLDCCTAFQRLFVEILCVKVFPKEFNVTEYVSKMVRRPQDTLEDRTRYLERLLENKIEVSESKAGEEEEDAVIKGLRNIELPLKPGARQMVDGVVIACQVLVDLSSIPTVKKRRLLRDDELQDSGYGCAPSELPAWLQYLLVSSCLLNDENCVLQLQCISALLELVGLLQSTLFLAANEDPFRPVDSEANIAIVVTPMLTEEHHQCIMKQTLVSQTVASRLWDGLGTLQPVFHLRCVALLYQLHNLVPSSSPKIERILARSLGAGDVDAYQRFTLLWHLSRDLESKRSVRQVRTFDICLLKMLDNLNLPSGPLKVLSQSWLVHAMAKGDIARLMEPLLLTLLDPSTARVSVLHTQIEHMDTVDADSTTHRVYSISSANGEAIYHVSDRCKSGGVKDKSRKGAADKAKKIFALNKFQKSSPRSSLDYSSRREQSCNNEANDLTTASLMVNPFALVPPEVEEYKFFTRGYEDSSEERSVSSVCDSFEVSEETLDGVQTRDMMTKLLDDVINDAVEQAAINRFDDLDSMPWAPDHKESRRHSSAKTAAKSLSIHPQHSHLLLYAQVCDSRQVLYTMRCIKNILQTNPRLSLCTLSTTHLNSATSARNNQIQMLLARHRKSVFGKGFVGALASENLSTYRNATLAEVLISTLLYFLRSYYPNLGGARLSEEEEILSNREVQLMSIDILTVLVSELVLVVRDNGRAYATYISDLFARCKVQKVVLHSLLACINDMRDGPKRKEEEEVLAFTDDILQFNEINSMLVKNDKNIRSSSGERISNYSEAFQVQVLRLLLAMVMLEQAISLQRGEQSTADKLKAMGPAEISERSVNGGNGQQSHVLRYHNDHVIPDQPMFLAAIVSALRQEKMRHLHSHWTSLVTSCLPFLGRSLSQSVLEVTAQLSRNLERLAPFYTTDPVGNDGDRDEHLFGQIPADYVVTQLEALTMIYHYCLLDSSTTQSGASISQPQSSLASSSSSGPKQPDPGSEILANLLHVFLSNTDSKSSLTPSHLGVVASVDAMGIARRILLSTLPRLMSTVCILWQAVDEARKGEAACILVGSPKVVRSRLLDLVSPIAHHHPTHFLASMASAWHERRSFGNSSKNPVPPCNDDQRILVDLCASVRTFPMATVLQTVRQVIKAPPSSGSSKSGAGLETALLQFFYAYLSQCSPIQIFESWSGLASLLRDCLPLAPPALFLALAITNQFVQRAPAFTEKREQRELQDIACKLVEAVAQVGGSCLEQTTWLRRHLEVNQELQVELERHQEEEDDDDEQQSSSIVSSTSSEQRKKQTSSVTQYAVSALSLLGEMLAPFLDVVYNSEEKEKVLPLMHTVMYNVVPYLRNHTRGNSKSFRACSRLLASLSEYQYTRKAWKKDSVELLLDPAFFQLDLPSLQHWEVTVDNLMTHDKTTFKELMAKVSSISQSGSLSLFSSKEQELEQRALLLKRLAFVIYCSDVDQYQKQMPDIQERLAESLRTIPSSPAVQASVFLCFRVILVRMSSHHVTSLWPLIITEMVQIFSYLEQELSTDSEEWSTHLKRMSTLDSSWVVSAGSNGLVAHNSPPWMALYLAVCKLLDLALALPAPALPQFQMYRWAFVSESSGSRHDHRAAVNGDVAMGAAGLQQQDFVPYVVRVARLLLSKIEKPVRPLDLMEGQPQLSMTSITSLDDLGPFFASVCQNVTRQQTKSSGIPSDQKQKTKEMINDIIERDFLEAIQA